MRVLFGPPFCFAQSFSALSFAEISEAEWFYEATPQVNDLNGEVDQYGDIAQLGERQLCKLEVTGSIPVISTRQAN